MAEIQVERTKNSSATGWVVLVVVLIALLGAGWFFLMGPGATTRPDVGPSPIPGGVAPETAPNPAPRP